jgi:hypothetical protein
MPDVVAQATNGQEFRAGRFHDVLVSGEEEGAKR